MTSFSPSCPFIWLMYSFVALALGGAASEPTDGTSSTSSFPVAALLQLWSSASVTIAISVYNNSRNYFLSVLLLNWCNVRTTWTCCLKPLCKSCFLLCSLTENLSLLENRSSLPSIFSLLGLWLVLFIFFAILFLEVFGLTKWGGAETHVTNYSSLGSAMVMLSFQSTGSVWSFLPCSMLTFDYDIARVGISICTTSMPFFCHRIHCFLGLRSSQWYNLPAMHALARR